MEDRTVKSRINKVGDLIYPELSYKIVGVLFDVHNKLGAGLQEKHYQKAIAEALRKKDLQFEEQVRISIKFNGRNIGDYYPPSQNAPNPSLEMNAKRVILRSFSEGGCFGGFRPTKLWRCHRFCRWGSTLDFLVENKIVIELKTKRFAKEYYSQISSYLKATGIKLGIVAIFGRDELKFRRIVNLY